MTTRTVRIGMSVAALAAFGASAIRAQTPEEPKMDRVQVGVGLTPAADSLLGAAGSSVIRAFEAALAREGMGAITSGASARFMLAVDVQPLFEEITGTAPALVVVRARGSAVFGDTETRRAIAEFNREVRAVGRTREAAYRTVGNGLRLEGEAWEAATEEANQRIIAFFENSCDALLQEANTMVRQDQFEEAILHLTSVPREARNCQPRAREASAEVYRAMQANFCQATLSWAHARWVAGATRESAREVADSLGLIPGGSSCMADAQSLLEDVAVVIATFDSAAAERERQEFGLRKTQYDDALALTRERMQHDTALRSQAQQNDYLVRTAAVEAAARVGIERARFLATRDAGTKKLVQFSP